MPLPTVVLDVNETLSDLGALAPVLREVGAPESLLGTWFAGTLRDGFALTLQGEPAAFADVARAVLVGLLAQHPDRVDDVDAAADAVLDAFRTLPVHPDVPDGLRALADAGFPVVTLSNGATSVAEALLEQAGVRDRVSQVLSVEDTGGWKPARAAYSHAEAEAGRSGADLLLVAVHPWDLDGASRAGWRTAHLDRTGAPWPPVFRRPTHHLTALADLPTAVG
ncbi:haloacid dehalogenase type II [Microlunatus capsulatus]|uniref:haloacid dehalogenase type II n=1 Tax=Microlunatus capsulatus TaxID=99117 RepID=UPI0031DFDB52